MRPQLENVAEMSHTPITAVEVWHALSVDLRKFLRVRVPTESDADDLVQDVFVRVVEKIGSLRQAGRIESWVYQIARNAIADFYRRRANHPTHAVDDEVFETHDENDGGNQNHVVGTWLALMIGQLPEIFRDPVRMYEIDGLGQAEIAGRLGVSLSGAKSRVQRGRSQLEQILRDCCGFDLDRRGNVIGCKPVKPDGCAKVSCQCDGNV